MNTLTIATPVLTLDTSPESDSSTLTVAHPVASATSTTVASQGHSELTTPGLSFSSFSTESELFDYFHQANSSLEIYLPIEQYQALPHIPTDAEYTTWEEGQPVDDPLDRRAKKSFYLDEAELFRCPFHAYQKFLPRTVELHDISPSEVPSPICELRCLEIRVKAMLPRIVGTGTLIPARAGHGRAMVLAPFYKGDRVQYILCLHGKCDVFLVRAPDYLLEVSWSSWTQLKDVYGNGNFAALFSSDMYTVEGRMEGVRRQKRWLEQRLRGFLPPLPRPWWTRAWSSIQRYVRHTREDNSDGWWVV
jgi:hypothetical protein